MTEIKTNRITTLNYKGQQFEILKREDGWFIAINHNDIDDEGKLKRTMNGFEMFARRTAQDTMNSVMMKMDIDEIMFNQGIDRTQATIYYMKNKADA